MDCAPDALRRQAGAVVRRPGRQRGYDGGPIPAHVVISAILYSKGIGSDGVRRFVRRLGGSRGEEAVILAGKAVRVLPGYRRYRFGPVGPRRHRPRDGGCGRDASQRHHVHALRSQLERVCLSRVIWLYWAAITSGDCPPRGDNLGFEHGQFPASRAHQKGADLPLVLIFTG